MMLYVMSYSMSRAMNSELSLFKGLLTSSSALYSLSPLTRKALRRVHLYILIANVSLIAAWLEIARLLLASLVC
jgi:hypothetical protein